ncbi:uncharacterized protein LOC142494110 [Ascaphus truei]|uniref:uncharacterized protein LOC142494110 n=1 Tax=Ascaphus truei TaxID=8439 RepID=UPI003F59BF64
MEQSVQKTTTSPEVINKMDTPRTSNLKYVRAKRLAYFSGENAKSTLCDIKENSISQTHKRTVPHQLQRSRTPRRCLSAPIAKGQEPIFTSSDIQKSNDTGRKIANTPKATDFQSVQQETSSREPHQSLLRSSFISDLDQDLLEDMSVPETEKLKHVMSWAKKFLNKCNGGDNVQNSSLLSHEAFFEDGKAPYTRDEETSAFDTTFFSSLHNKHTKDNETESEKVQSAPLDIPTKYDVFVESTDISKVKKQLCHNRDVEMPPQTWWIPTNPGAMYTVKTSFNQTLTSTPESHSFLSQWKPIENNEQVDATMDLVVAHGFHEDKKDFTEPLCSTFSPRVKRGLNMSTYRNINNISLMQHLSDCKAQEECNEEKHIIGNIEECKQWDYESMSTRSEVKPKDNCEPQEDRPGSLQSSLDTERLDSLLIDFFERSQKGTEKRLQLTEKDGERTDRTFLVRKFAENDTSVTASISQNEIDRSDNKKGQEAHLYRDHSASSLPEEFTVKSYKVCPMCDCANNTNTSWCMECGSILLAAEGHNPRKGTENKSQVTHKKFQDEIFVPRGATTPGYSTRSLEKSPRSKLNKKEDKVICWDDSSEITSDCDGSVMEKYVFYLNQLDMIRSQEQKKQTQYLLSGHSSELASEDEFSAVYDKTNSHGGHKITQQDAISDSEESEIQFLEASNCVVKPALTYSGQEAKDPSKSSPSLEENLKGFTRKSYETKVLKEKAPLDRKLQKLHISSKVTGPKRYWEKSSIAWSSYTHGELKPRSQCLQRPASAEAREKIPGDQCQGDKLRDHTTSNKRTNPSQRPSSASIAPATTYQSNAVAYMKTANTWAVSEHLCQSKWDGFAGTLKWDSEGVSMWLLLPDELWICIFSQLSHKDLSLVAQVCRRFRYIANDDSLWKIIEITNCHSLTDDCLINIGLHHPESLTLYRCHDDTQCITEEGLIKLFQHCKDALMELKITNCGGPRFEGDAVFLHASNYCDQLTSVDISWTAATDTGIIAIVESSSSLQNLSLNGCKITDQAINILVKKHWKRLVKLEVFGCHALTAKCLTSVATECAHLQILNIGRIPKVTDVCLAKIASKLKNMTTLNVTGLNVVRDRVVHQIVKQCPNLENLTLSSCCQVTDVSLVEISTYLQTIKYLDVSGCKKVSDIGIQALARSCRQIRYLDLSSTAAGKRGVCLLASYCHTSLECLKLSFCKEVTADAIEKLCKNCTRLKMLHLYGCRISPDLQSIKKFNKAFKIFHDLSIPAANILGE